MRRPPRWVQPQLPFDRDEEPVWLPAHIEHGTPSAYNRFQGRCWICADWRRSYDREYWELKRAQREKGRKR